MRKMLLAMTLVIMVAALVAGWLFSMVMVKPEPELSSTVLSQKDSLAPSPSAMPQLSAKPLITAAPSIKTVPDAVDWPVPFTVQAPAAQWSDPAFQDACEEASILMAAAWAGQAKFSSPADATRAIQALVDYQKERGEYRDRSSYDTAQLMRDYFHYSKITWRENITVEDIIVELAAGNVVIVPVDGQALHNPHFTPPGPERHMVVIRGFDKIAKEFITNDSGTRFGAGYRYNQAVLFNAIRDYQTGYHIPIIAIEKNMVVVAK